MPVRVPLPALQCIAKTEGGKRVVAGVHWDYDCYGEIPSSRRLWIAPMGFCMTLADHHSLRAVTEEACAVLCRRHAEEDSG